MARDDLTPTDKHSIGTAVLWLCLAALVVILGIGVAMLASRVPQLGTTLWPDPAPISQPRLAP
jgi:thymidine phosphorylase